MPVLTAEDREFFEKNGYVIVREAVPPENLDAVIRVIWEYLGMNPANADDWYHAPLSHSGMLEIYQHSALWNNRQTPRLYQAFAELLETPKLWVSFDRVNMKPPQHPAHPEYDNKGFIHWDTDTRHLPSSLRVQGVLCLTDTISEMGGFQCVPELYQQLDEWIATQPLDRNPRVPDLSGFKITPVPARAGDLIIWNTLLPHGNGHNVSDKPRLAQYISMFPAREDNEAFRQARLEQWCNMEPPKAEWVVGDPRRWEQTEAKPAELGPLGRKLLGLDSWNEDYSLPPENFAPSTM